MWRDILSSPVPSAKNALQSQIWYCCKLKRVNTYNLIKITQQLLYFNYCKNKSICSTSEVVICVISSILKNWFPVCNFPSFSFLHKWKSFAPRYGKVDLGWLCHLIFFGKVIQVRQFRAVKDVQFPLYFVYFDSCSKSPLLYHSRSEMTHFDYFLIKWIRSMILNPNTTLINDINR